MTHRGFLHGAARCCMVHHHVGLLLRTAYSCPDCGPSAVAKLSIIKIVNSSDCGLCPLDSFILSTQ
jgi:hypothetical protein